MKEKLYEVGVFIFRRDLRLDDNLGLLRMLGECKSVVPVFCLDENQIVENDRNKHYFSAHAVQFMCESLKDLNAQLEVRNSRLRLFFGLPWVALAETLAELKQKHSSVAVGWNADYSRYSKYRDSQISDLCAKNKVSTVVSDSDLLLRPMAEYEKRSPGAFKQFSPFCTQAATRKPELPVTVFEKAVFAASSLALPGEFALKRLSEFVPVPNEQLAQRGGREAALGRLATLKKFKNYGEKRDFLGYSTTNLSAAQNFGCVSVRETYWAVVKELGAQSELLRQLYWRDFLHQMAEFDAEANNYGRHIDARFDNIHWRSDSEASDEWEKLMNSQTGFLIIDAAIAEMKTTGFIGNRARMVLGSAWVKYLRINPLHPVYGVQVGYSKFFVDAVGCTQNKLNCQWLTELDFAGRRYAAPGVALSGRMMDISNKQLKKWDPDCVYVKKWLPKLKNIPNEYLFDWDEATAKKFKLVHPGPIFDAKTRLEQWVDACRGL